jgi:alkylated DNA repair protein (DNA oxidative demethylase)
MFGSKVIGISLLSSCRMRFQRRTGDGRRPWQHSVSPTKALRYSLTLRSLRRR